MARTEVLEAQRILALYRKLVLLGKARVPLAAGRRLVGPDCAYHLYFRHAGDESPRPQRGEASRRASKLRPRPKKRQGRRR